MLGAIIGDIVGSRFERHNHKSKDFDLFTDRCRFTDDTAMTVAVAKALLECKGDYNEWHPCRYIDCTLEHDGSWVDGKWYEWEDIYGNREVARMKLDAMDHFYPNTKIIKEENVRRYREIMEGEN